jgi:DNA-binding transcriptional LysR family regulator
LARWTLVADEIHSGRLVAAGRAVKYERSYWFVCPARSQDLPGVKIFMDWIRAEAEQFAARSLPELGRTHLEPGPRVASRAL